MIFGTLPSNVFGEVKNVDWDVKEEVASKMDFWDLAKNNELCDTGLGDPIKTPSLNYVGTYINSDGRTVVRMSFKYFQNLATGV